MRRAMFLGTLACGWAAASLAAGQVQVQGDNAAPGAPPAEADANPAAPAPAATAGASSVGPTTTGPYPPPTTGSAAGTTGAPDSTPATQLDAERLATWNSPDMLEARGWVLEYGRRSRQFNEAAAQEYLARVKRLSPTAMRAWLAQLAARRANLARSNDVTQSARQRAVAQTFLRLQQEHEARELAARGQAQAATAAQGQLLAEQQFASERAAIRQAARSDHLWNMYYGRNYGMMLAFPDRDTKIAAMYTLPGNLPPSDPRNFLRDVPIDANGNVLTPGADVAGAAGVGPGAGPAVGAGAGGPP